MIFIMATGNIQIVIKYEYDYKNIMNNEYLYKNISSSGLIIIIIIILFFSTISCLLYQRLLYSLKKKKTEITAGKPIRLFFLPSKRVCIMN